MERYESKQGRIEQPASMIYQLFSDFTRFTPVLADKVENWEATPDTCSFTVKGFNVSLRIVEREENKLVKIEGDDGSPFDFTFWVQLKEAGPSDTRFRLVLAANLNMMMKMMAGNKIKSGLDSIVDQVSTAFAMAPVMPAADFADNFTGFTSDDDKLPS